MSEKRKAEQAKLQAKIKQATAHLAAHLDDPQAYYQLGTYLVEVKSYPQAEELFLKAQRHFANDAAASRQMQYGLGNVYYASQTYDKAQATFLQLTKAPHNKLTAAANLMLAQTYLAQSQYKLSCVYALTAQTLAHGSEQVAATLVLAESLLSLGEFAAASDQVQQVVTAKTATTKQQAQAYVYLAVAQMGLASVPATTVRANLAKAQKLAPKYYDQVKQRLDDATGFVQHLAQKDKK